MKSRARVVGATWALILCATVASGSAESTVVDLTIQGSTPPKEARVVRVSKGDEVVLRVTTDTRVTIHLHGYELERTVSPDAPTSMRFRASATGRFPIEVHARGSEWTLAYLEVHPR